MRSSGVKLERRATDVITGKVRPLRDHILVKAEDWKPSKTIQIAGNHRKALRGTVVAVGPGCYPKRYNANRSKMWDSRAFRATEVKVGDTVELGGLEIGGYSFPELIIDNELHVMAREEDVTGIVE